MKTLRGHTPENQRPTHTVVVGLQWGDEGKGKIVDLLTVDHDVIVRYNGGANAGHTIVADTERYVLHLIPSGILYPKKLCVIANGVMVDPEELLEELDALRKRGVEVGDNLRLSDHAHVVMPYHKEQDAALETLLSSKAASYGLDLFLGTTQRGIGPSHQDKANRYTAIRVGELLDADRLQRKLRVICTFETEKRAVLGGQAPPLNPDELAQRYAAFGRRLRPHITDTTYLLHDCLDEGRSILFEGANACLLDIDHGTYPYVTSSNCSALGVPAGTGVPGQYIDRVLGTMKAYTTRVGEGPFPTEQDNAIGERMRERGQEYGSTTDRPRRCGWLDLVGVRYSAMLCGTTGLACMLLDVLSGFDELKLCTRYRLPDGTITDRFIADAYRLSEIEAVYETLPGWSEEIDDATDRAALPGNAQRYLERIEQVVGVPIEIVSVGPERTQTVVEV